MSNINPDNVCSHLYKETKYNPDCLNEMLAMQNSLQEFMEERGRHAAPSNKETTYHEKALSAIYFWGCVTTEHFEMMEALQPHMEKGLKLKDLDQETLLEIQYEYIDMWHFLMNVVLFSGIDQTNIGQFEEFFDPLKTITTDVELDQAVSNVSAHFGILSANVGQLINNLPFKVWKNYDIDDHLKKSDAEGVLIWIMKSFIEIGTSLGITKEKFYSLYISKNQENYDRQNRDGAYNSQKEN